jgi:hypothetical protein
MTIILSVQTDLRISPASYAMGTGNLSPVAKRPMLEANHLPQSSAEVKNVAKYTTTPPYVFMA